MGQSTSDRLGPGIPEGSSLSSHTQPSDSLPADRRSAPDGEQPVPPDRTDLSNVRRSPSNYRRPSPAGTLQKTSAQGLSNRSPTRSSRPASAIGAAGTLSTRSANGTAVMESQSMTGGRCSMSAALGLSHGMSAEVISSSLAFGLCL